MNRHGGDDLSETQKKETKTTKEINWPFRITKMNFRQSRFCEKVIRPHAVNSRIISPETLHIRLPFQNVLFRQLRMIQCLSNSYNHFTKLCAIPISVGLTSRIKLFWSRIYNIICKPWWWWWWHTNSYNIFELTTQCCTRKNAYLFKTLQIINVSVDFGAVFVQVLMHIPIQSFYILMAYVHSKLFCFKNQLNVHQLLIQDKILNCLLRTKSWWIESKN